MSQLQDTTSVNRTLAEETLNREWGDDAGGDLHQLDWLRDHPYDLNTVSCEQLAALPGVTAIEAEEVVAFRDRFKGLSSIEQLLAMEGERADLLEKIRPYVYVVSVRSALVRKRIAAIRMRIVTPGGEDSAYTGGKTLMYGRATVDVSEKLMLGTVWEKDRGEAFRSAFSSWYIAAKNIGPLVYVVIGDFVADAGQGLLLSRGARGGMSVDPIASVSRSGSGFRAHASSSEGRFFHGGAAAIRMTAAGVGLQGAVMFSRRMLNATLNEDGIVTSLYDAGLFRTGSEELKKSTLREDLAGFRLIVNPSASVAVGWTYYRSRYDRPLSTSDLTGEKVAGLGIDCTVRFRRAMFFAEAARTTASASALIAGMVLSFPSGAGCTFQIRHFPAEFCTMHAGTSGGAGNTRNERGAYLGWQLPFFQSAVLKGHIDQWKTLTPSSGKPLPSASVRVSLRCEMTVSPRVAGSVGFSHSTTAEGKSEKSLWREVVSVVIHPLPWAWLSGAVTSIRLLNTPANTWSTGCSFSQGIRCRMSLLDLEARVAFFDADAYETRVYEYERELPGLFGRPLLYGKGCRWYLLGMVRAAKTWTLSLKCFQTVREDSRGTLTRDTGLGLQADFNI